MHEVHTEYDYENIAGFYLCIRFTYVVRSTFQASPDK